MKGEVPRGLQFEIRYPDGNTQRLVVDSDTALIGSGAHCEIRLSSEHASVESVAISVTGAGVQAQAFDLDSLPTINGTEFITTSVLQGSIIGVGAIQITVELVEIVCT